MNTAQTRLCGLIGWPVEHSRSPEMHNAAFLALQLDYVYLAFAVAPNHLRSAIVGAQVLGLRGLNVTVPHKVDALALCQPDELSAKVGAVNTLTFEGDRCLGSNTDVHGFSALLGELALRPRRVLVLGQGGAARAVATALFDRVDQLTLVARRPARLMLGNQTVEVLPWQPPLLADRLATCDLLVDATSRGLHNDPETIDLERLSSSAVVIDLTARTHTPLTAAARQRGLAAHTGSLMLLHQGARAFELWTGRPAPLAVMRETLESRR